LQPVRGLAEAIAASIENAAPGPQRIEVGERWATRLEAGQLGAALDAARGMNRAGTLIIVDPFEEFFTAQETQIERQRAVILPQFLSAAARSDVRCVLTARLDFIERMVTTDNLAARMLTDPFPVFVLTAMSPGEVQEAIEGPARVFGARVEAG